MAEEKPAKEKAAAKKPAAKKKTAAEKETPAKKTAAKKPAAKKAAAKKPAAKKPSAKKPAAKKSSAEKEAAAEKETVAAQEAPAEKETAAAETTLAAKETAPAEKETAAAKKPSAKKQSAKEKEAAGELKPSAETKAEPAATVAEEPGERFYGTGRRKRATARVFVRPGGGGIFVVNKQPMEKFFPRARSQMVARQALEVMRESGGVFDVFATVAGGGESGQAEAVRHGVSRAMVAYRPENKPALRAAGFISRDARAVERKKVGLRKARRARQYSKR